MIGQRALQRHGTRTPRDSRSFRPTVEHVEDRPLLSTSSPLALGMNLNSVNEWTTSLMFNDVMKYTNDTWNVVKSDSIGYPWNISGVSLPAMDDNGYPVGMGSLKAQGYGLMTYAFTQTMTSYPAGTYTLTFDGKGTVVVSQLGGSQAAGTFSQDGGIGRPHSVAIGMSPTGIQISIVDSDPADHVRNIRLIMPGYQDTYQTQPFYQPFLQGLQPFSMLRFMDTMRTNDQPLTDWSQRTTADYRTQTKDSGVAVEYMVQLANELHKDMWVNMPYKADDLYVENFARYVHDNLDPSLKVYVEYGNEVWNYAPGFNDSYQYVQDYANAHKLSTDFAIADLSHHDWEIWRSVFGAETGTTFLRVAASQFSNPWHLNQEITRLVATADPSDPDHGFDVVSGAPYFLPNSSNYNASTTTAQIVADALRAATGFGPMIDNFMAVRNQWETTLGQKIPAIMYEGGFALTASPSDSWYNAYLGTQTAPGMYDATMAYLNALYEHGVDGLVYYGYISTIGPYGPWGSMQSLTEPSASTPKYRALADYAAGRTGLDSLTGFRIDGLANATAGDSQTITVTALGTAGTPDADYVGTIHFTSSDSQAGLPADYTFRSFDQGVHTFTVALRTAGSQSVTVADLGRPEISQTQSGVLVSAADAGAFRVSGFPNTVAGVPNLVTVQATDIYGNPTTQYAGTVHFTTTDWQGSLPADYTFSPLDGGQHTFIVTLKAAGTQAITVTDTATLTMTGRQPGITVSPGPFRAFSVWPYPTTATAGVFYPVTVTATDGYHNVLPGYNGKIFFTSNDLNANLPADYTFQAGDQGSHVFRIALNSTGAKLVTIADLATPAAKANVWVQVKAGMTLNVSLDGSGTLTPSFGPGSPQRIRITAKNPNGTTRTGYRGTVHFTSSDPNAVLPADYTFTASDNGTHVFTVTLQTVGTQSITAQDLSNPAITGRLTGLRVSGAPAVTLRVTGFPSTVAGVAHSFTVSAIDANGNIVTDYTGTVHFSTNDWQGTLPANYRFTTADQGVHTFSATLRVARVHNLTVVDVAHPNLSGKQTGIDVTPAGFSRLVMLVPKNTTAGKSFTFTVRAEDAYHNAVPDYRGRVQFSSTDGQAGLPANYTFTAADQGVHQFHATLKTAGIKRLLSVAEVAHPLRKTNMPIAVSPGAAVSFRITGFPLQTIAGVSHSFIIVALDAYGNVATGYRGTIQLSSNDASADLPNNFQFSASDKGRHTFSAKLKTRGTAYLRVADVARPSISGAQWRIHVI